MVVNDALMIIAGCETTASALSAMAAHLFRDPKRMQKVVKEARENTKTEEWTNQKFLALPYLNASGHSPSKFRDPEAFIAERWLDEAYASDTKTASRPFSLGPRGRIGKHLAYLEMRVVLGRIPWNFGLASADEAWM
ncbi:cytochrome P450 [Saccharata proteae CBS 121410]|uniref:Cytochrome P450 n=1 Tax=Saccharata proteae CBS 121410 TaxID=1314787 RepID=A0A9P4HZR7_9PEZI|nr:cytochrome P450 [Saccharata proteae CBS 121410]